MCAPLRLVVLESGLGLDLDSSPDLSPFLLDLDLDLGSMNLDLDLDLKALDLDLDSDLEVLPASPFFKFFVLYLHLKNVLIPFLTYATD